jgi:biotin carboxylase
MRHDDVRPALLFIESNTSGTGRLFVRGAREIGCHPVLITARPDKYAYLSDDDAPEVVIVSRAEEAEIDAAIARRFHDGADIAGITSSSEYFIAMAAALAARRNLPGPDAECVRTSRDKSHQREVLAAGGVHVPQFRVVTSVAEAIAAAREIGVPVVVKPVSGSGSVGVRACASAAEAGRHAASLLSLADRADAPRVLVESLIEGPEYSVEVFSGRAIGITRKHLGARPHFVEAGHDYPAMPRHLATILTSTVERATALLGLQWGPLHWELRMHDGRACVIEVNPRLAGGFIPELVRHAEGLDLIRETLRLVVGQEPALEPRWHRHASIRFLIAPAPGRFAAADGIDEARATPGVVDVTLYRAIGETLTVEGNFRDRIGHVIACDDDREAASASATCARDTMRIRVDDGREGEAGVHADGAREIAMSARAAIEGAA